MPQGTPYIPVQTAPAGCTACSAGRILISPRAFSGSRKATAVITRFKSDFTRRLSQGLQFRANYTWSKNLDMNSGLTIAQAQNQPQMIYNRNNLPLRLGTSGAECTSQSSMSSPMNCLSARA